MKWLLIILFSSSTALATSNEVQVNLKITPKTKERLREAQRSLASVDPALKPIQVRKMKAKTLILKLE